MDPYVRADLFTADDFWYRLSAREKEIVELMMLGYNEDAIAERAGISRSGYRDHVKNVWKKLLESVPEESWIKIEQRELNRRGVICRIAYLAKYALIPLDSDNEEAKNICDKFRHAIKYSTEHVNERETPTKNTDIDVKKALDEFMDNFSKELQL